MRNFFLICLIALSLCFFAGCGDKGKDDDKAGKEKEAKEKGNPEKDAREAFAKFKKALKDDKNLDEAKKYVAKSVLDENKGSKMMLEMTLDGFADVELEKTTAKVSGNNITFELVQKSEAKSTDGSPISGSITVTQPMLKMVKEDGAWKILSK